MTYRIALPLIVALLGAGCAGSGDYPSLARRPAEELYAAGDPERVPVPAPNDPALPGRIAAFVQAGRAGDEGFADALGRARDLAARAGSTGSDSWVEAQQALSRAAAARSATSRALADLDAYAIERARQGPLSPADAERLAGATAALQALADRQQDQTESLGEMLRRR
ncbi:hypothetical protein E2493_05180 [Sphingomonas parva]|uniref:Uncharacterized protein n=1 Tax=Sphingomonas parva TaxID=2555898 RepID=A0A4Y8ZWW4_9SPHN|nr:hypothetical protein [Sphingomonas parva]TFI59239.1 hypothetical protein E2493_05180 [Sphingomonas parva]